MPEINILLCSKNINQTKEFYEILGIECVEEKHGNGPIHFSLNTKISALEIYPPRIPDTAVIVFRIEVLNINHILRQLSNKYSQDRFLVQDIRSSKNGKKMIVKDPDNRILELIESL